MSDKIYNLGLDRRDRISQSLGSGFPKESIVVLTGKQGTGKSIWMQRFIKGFCEENYQTSYVTTEMNLPSFIQQMNSLNYNITKNILLESNLNYYQVDIDTEYKMKTYKNNKFDKRTILPELVSKESEDIWDSQIVIIDNLGFMLYNDPYYKDMNSELKYKVIRNLMTFIERISKNKTCVILSINPENLEENIFNHITKRSTVNLKIEKNKTSTGFKNLLIPKKFQKTQQDIDDLIYFNIQNQRGLTVESSTVV